MSLKVAHGVLYLTDGTEYHFRHDPKRRAHVGRAIYDPDGSISRRLVIYIDGNNSADKILVDKRVIRRRGEPEPKPKKSRSSIGIKKVVDQLNAWIDSRRRPK